MLSYVQFVHYSHILPEQTHGLKHKTMENKNVPPKKRYGLSLRYAQMALRGVFTCAAINFVISAFLAQRPHHHQQFWGGTSASAGIRAAHVFRHLQPARTFVYIMFDAGNNAVAAQMDGMWREEKDRVLIGFVDV